MERSERLAKHRAEAPVPGSGFSWWHFTGPMCLNRLIHDLFSSFQLITWLVDLVAMGSSTSAGAECNQPCAV
jgi:hypothetical protein